MLKVNAVRLMLKSGMSSWDDDAGAEKVRVTTKTDIVTMEVMSHLRRCVQ